MRQSHAESRLPIGSEPATTWLPHMFDLAGTRPKSSGSHICWLDVLSFLMVLAATIMRNPHADYEARLFPRGLILVRRRRGL